MVGDGFQTESEMLGDGAIAVALGNQQENLALAISQFGKEVRQDGRARSGEKVDQVLGDGWTEDGFAAAYSPDGSEDLVLVGILEDVSARTGTQGCEDGMVVLEHGDDQDADVRADRQDAPCGLNTADPWHLQVHQDHFWLKGGSQGNDLVSVGCYAHSFHIRD